MKKLLITLTTLAVIPATYAQITVTSNDLVFPVGNDTALLKIIDPNSVAALPQDGADEFWDYSGLTVIDSTAINLPESDGLHGFTGSTAMNDEPLEFGTFTLENSSYYTQNGDGFFNTGYFIPVQGFDIGGAGDTLVLTGDTIDLDENYPIVNFPVQYGDIHANFTNYHINFDLTYGIFPPNTPGYLQRDISVESRVAGWGRLVYPGSEDTLDVLLIYKEQVYLDSIFAGGAPVPPAILAGTGLEQGMETVINTMEFVTIGLQMPVISFTLNESADTVVSGYYTYETEDSVISVKNIEMNKLNIYPNPAKDFVVIDFSGKNISSANVVAEIYSLDGRKVADRQVKNGRLDVKDLSQAAYVVRIMADNQFAGFFRLVKED